MPAPCQALIPSASIPGLPQSCTGQLQTEEEKELKPGARSMFTARGPVQKKPQGLCTPCNTRLNFTGDVSWFREMWKYKCWAGGEQREMGNSCQCCTCTAVTTWTGKPPGDTELNVTHCRGERQGSAATREEGAAQRGDGHTDCPWSCTCSSSHPRAA